MIQRTLSTNHTIELSIQEEVQLRSVFETLAGYASSGNKQMEATTLSATAESTVKQGSSEALSGLISIDDISAILTKIGHPLPRPQIEIMIWEIDENLDGFVDWEEMQLTYYRNIHDESHLEPFRLFYLIQFLIFDRELKGVICIDDAMPVLFARLGKSKMELYLDWIFGGKNIINGSGNTTTTFSEYILRVYVRGGVAVRVN